MPSEPAASLLLMADAGLLVLIWLVQAVIYPGFRHLDPGRFAAAHSRYMNAMGWIVGPLMIGQLSLSILVAAEHPDPVNLMLLGLVLLTWLSTAAFSVPLHRRLQKLGPDPATLRRLVLTNWPRTVLWTLIAALRFGLSVGCGSY